MRSRKLAEGSARGIEALRAAVATVFEVVYVSPGNPDFKWPFYLEPVVRGDMTAEIEAVALSLPVPKKTLSGSGVPE